MTARPAPVPLSKEAVLSGKQRAITVEWGLVYSICFSAFVSPGDLFLSVSWKVNYVPIGEENRNYNNDKVNQTTICHTIQK